jgi:butyryl-CoA dehydrogenase
VEQFYRDNRLNPIHEGTHGVQGLDLLGRKVAMKNGAGLLLLIAAVRETMARAAAAGGDAAGYGVLLGRALERLAATTPHLFEAGSPDRILANSTYYLEATGHLVVAWMWLEQLLACGASAGDFYDGKRQAARYFFSVELPRTTPLFDLLDANDTTSLDMDPAWF